MMCMLPVERALSTTFCISQGERNCPFLMFTGLPCEQAATMKFVWRQRKAGVCRTSTTAATSSSGVSSCTSVKTGTPIWSRTLARAFRPPSRPGPRKLERDERFALSNDALKMNGILSAPVISLSRPATSMTKASLSMTQGPAIKKNGRSCPTSKDVSFMRSCGGAARLQRGPVLARRSDEAGEQGVAIARRGSEFRVKLTGHKPRMAGQLDKFHQPVGGEAREAQPRRRQLVQIMIIELVAMAMTLENRLLTVQGPGE